MNAGLRDIAKKYAEVIGRIETTSDPKQLRQLEEYRVELHWKLLDELKKSGIVFLDREHAAQIAFKIARGEM